MSDFIPRPLAASSQLSLSGATVTPLHPIITDTAIPGLDSEHSISEETLHVSVRDSNWKIRKESFIMLRLLLHKAAEGHEPGHLNADDVLEGLDCLVPSIVADKNASALDFGLQCAIDYAEFCKGATSADQATAIITSLFKSGGFSASRGSTVNFCSALTLKLMEVGAVGYQSVHAVVNVLLEKGLASKKPKEVIATTSVIFDAALDFGAGCLPLAAIKSSSSKMLSHTNATVRDTGTKILAEFCRVLGSKTPLQDVLGGMKKAQLLHLDEMLASQPNVSAPRVGLRNSRFSSSSNSREGSDEALAAFEEQAKELEAERFSRRPAIDLIQEIPRSDYSTRIILSKWSEKVGALDAVLRCGGETPYKLAQPSSSVNYASLVAEMRKLLGHTHFAVVSKAMQVITMLAEGVGEKIYPNLRPLLTSILHLSKDKKLTKNVSSCLDSLFGTVLSLEHLLEKDDSVPSLLDENKMKNALVRSSALEYLCRCSQRADSAGPRGRITARSASALIDLCIAKLGDSDATVRKAATDVLQSLLVHADLAIAQMADGAVESLKADKSRVYTAIKGTASKFRSRPLAPASSPAPSPPSLSPQSKPVVSASAMRQDDSKVRPDHGAENIPTNLAEIIGILSSIEIPNLDNSEEDGGIFEGLKSAKWQSRQRAIKSLATYCESDCFEDCFSSTLSSAILFLVKEYTKGFRESNFNIIKAVMELMITLCGIHARREEAFPDWASDDCTFLALDKILDKKLTDYSSTLLSDLCTVRDPKHIITSALSRVSTIKAPMAHEAFLKWMQSFCVDFGASVLTAELNNMVPQLLQECENSNLPVRKAALSVVCEMHSQLGPSFRALVLSFAPDAIKAAVEKACEDNQFDPRAGKEERSRRCVVLRLVTGYDSAENVMKAIEVPKTDLVAEIGVDCIAKLGSKEGKAAWKQRKEAMDKVDESLKKCAGMLATSPSQLKALVELLRVLKERLSDSQSNLKPVAARLIGVILGSVEKVAQATLGKIVFSALVNAAINDGRKPMRDATLKALSDGTKTSELEGGELNSLALEALVFAFVGEVGSAEIKAGGLPDLISLIAAAAARIPDLDAIVGTRAQPLGEKFASTVIDCLTSSKSETRSVAEDLLRECLKHGAISSQTVRSGLAHLKPAQQRAISPIIAGLVSPLATSSPRGEKENQPRTDSSQSSRSISTQSVAKRNLIAPRSAAPTQVAKAVSRSQLIRKSEIVEPEKRTGGHPLGRASSGSKSTRLNRRHNWPEYPEEPSGTTLHLSSLKKAWNTLPSPSVAALFPEGGIKQQEDAQGGCHLLVQAIHADVKEGSSEVIQHLDLILKWISVALCSREKTIGLQAILALLMDLFTFLAEREYTMLDEESSVIVPFVMEKASIAKGRFKELFQEVLSLLDSCGVISDKSFGSFICATVIERTHQPKARVMAFQECSRCIERIGLAGIGKKGLLLTAKSLSEETLPENRTAALDLLEIVLSKMDGDVEKLTRVCGSNMSDKSRALLEERCCRRGGLKSNEGHTKPALSKTSSLAKGQLVQPKSRSVQTLDCAEGAHDDYASVNSVFRSSLDLRLGGKSVLTTYSEEDSSFGGPFSFSFNPSISSSAMQSPDPVNETMKFDASTIAPALSYASTNSELEIKAASSKESSSSPTGAAASLRARLLKIRDKHRVGDVQPQSQPVLQSLQETSQKSMPLSQSTYLVSEEPHDQRTEFFGIAIETMEQLICKPVPIMEDDVDLLQSISVLKKFHSAVSTPADALDSDLMIMLRQKVEAKTSQAVECLTGVLGYAFTCGPEDKEAGMSVPLVSVTLATLMALFRDERLSRKVSLEALVLLIRETGRALLDSRLSVSSHRASSLDESTSSQMVRAINKLAVQASTGSSRHVSLQALMMLQQQLMLQETESPNDTAFNRRVSRIVTKLFGKVIQAEQGEVDPFSSATIDMESLICALEDLLVAACENLRAGTAHFDEARSTCESMATTLLQAMIGARGSNDIRNLMSDLEFDSSSHLLSMIDSVDPQQIMVSIPSLASSPSKQSVSKDVASLVSAVANANAGVDRDRAVDNLRRHREQNGDEELHAHLSEVSATFRTFVLQHLNDVRPTNATAIEGLAVSERLRNLRSKLNATDASLPAEAEVMVLGSSSHHSTRPSSITASPRRVSPSKIPRPKISTPSGGVSSLRQRLAAAQESRAKADDGGQTKSAYGHASALRARLEAVKNQNK